MKNKKKLIVLFSIINIILLPIVIYLFYEKVYLNIITKPMIKLDGKKEITISVFDTYLENGYTAYFRNENITKEVIIDSNVDTNKTGKYLITYTVENNKKKASKQRVINVVDNISPEITLLGEEETSLIIGEEYQEEGYEAYDNYDGNITEKVIVTNNIDKDNEGTYKVTYEVCDTSNNCYSKERNIIYTKPIFKTMPSEDALANNIAVLNYHFFSDPTIGEEYGDSNYITVQKFEEQLNYLKENNYKTLTMEEFRAWMYGEIELPARSVLLTIDDGARGTGKHNGNKLIPLLEKYQSHATLFLITGWWDKSNYESEYLDLESHSNDMHTSSYCTGVSRGAKILCINDEEVKQDLIQSINILGSSTAFCFPFYAYNNHAINLVKEVGFKLSFVGGGYKANRNTNKYTIPRYHIYSTVTLSEFNNMIA